MRTAFRYPVTACPNAGNGKGKLPSSRKPFRETRPPRSRRLPGKTLLGTLPPHPALITALPEKTAFRRMLFQPHKNTGKKFLSPAGQGISSMREAFQHMEPYISPLPAGRPPPSPCRSRRKAPSAPTMNPRDLLPEQPSFPYFLRQSDAAEAWSRMFPRLPRLPPAHVFSSVPPGRLPPHASRTKLPDEKTAKPEKVTHKRCRLSDCLRRMARRGKGLLSAASMDERTRPLPDLLKTRVSPPGGQGLPHVCSPDADQEKVPHSAGLADSLAPMTSEGACRKAPTHSPNSSAKNTRPAGKTSPSGRARKQDSSMPAGTSTPKPAAGRNPKRE